MTSARNPREIFELLSTLFPASGQVRLYADLAPEEAREPFSVYRIIGSVENETLRGNVGGTAYTVQIDSTARNPAEAAEASATIRDAVVGRHRAPSGRSVRVDFDSERTLGGWRTADRADTLYSWSADYTFWPGY